MLDILTPEPKSFYINLLETYWPLMIVLWLILWLAMLLKPAKFGLVAEGVEPNWEVDFLAFWFATMVSLMLFTPLHLIIGAALLIAVAVYCFIKLGGVIRFVFKSRFSWRKKN